MGRGLQVLRLASCVVLGARLLGSVETPAGATPTTTLVSASSSGGTPNGPSAYPAVSANGRYVAFHSAATDLVKNDTNNSLDVFRRDLKTGKTLRVSVSSSGGNANSSSQDASISSNGGSVAFDSYATDLVAGIVDDNGLADVFVREITQHTTVLASVSTTGGVGNSGSAAPSISSDGRYVAFESDASTSRRQGWSTAAARTSSCATWSRERQRW